MPGQATAQARLDFRVLGELEVRVNGGPAEELTPGQRTLLGTLLLHANEVVLREDLARGLWPDDPIATALRRLNAQVTGLRKRLATQDDNRRLIETVPGGYVLSAETGELDALRFRALSGEGQAALASGAAGEAAGLLRDALALWRGPVLGGESGEPVGKAARELESLHEVTATAQVEAELAVEQELARERKQALARERKQQLARERKQQLAREREQQLAQEREQALAREREQQLAQEREQALAREREQQLAQEREQALAREREREIASRAVAVSTAARLDDSAERGGAVAAEAPTEPADAMTDGEVTADDRPRPRLRGLQVAAVLLSFAAVAAAAFLLVRDDRPPEATAALRVVPIPVEPNTVVQLDPTTGAVLASFNVAPDPGQVAIAGGDVWALSAETGTVSHVDAEAGDVETIDSVPGVSALAASDSDGVWITSSESPAVRRLATEGFPDPRAVSIDPEVSALGIGGGYVWAVSPPDEQDERETVALVELSTGDVERRVPIGGNSRFVAYGHGVAWITSQNDDTITTVAPSGAVQTIEVGPGPAGIAVTDDAVWVAHFWNAELWRIDPSTKAVLARIPLGQGAYDVEAGLEAVWVTSLDSRTVTRVDPETNRVAATFQLAFPAYGLAIGDGTLWATIRACGSPVYAC